MCSLFLYSKQDRFFAYFSGVLELGQSIRCGKDMAFDPAEISAASGNLGSPEPSPEPDQVDGVAGWMELRCFSAGPPGGNPDSIRCIGLHPTREIIYAGTASGALHAHEVESAERIASSRPDGNVAALRQQDPAVRSILVAGSPGAPDAVMVACASGVRVLSRGCAPYAAVTGVIDPTQYSDK